MNWNGVTFEELQDIRSQLNAIDTGKTLRKIDDLEHRLHTLGRKLDAYEARAKERKVTGGATFVVG